MLVSLAVPVQAVISAQQDWVARLPSPVIKTRPPVFCLELKGTQNKACKASGEWGLAWEMSHFSASLAALFFALLQLLVFGWLVFVLWQNTS